MKSSCDDPYQNQGFSYEAYDLCESYDIIHHQSSNHPSVITGCPLESFVSDRKLGRRLLKQPWLVRPGDESFQAQQVRDLSQVGLNSKECHL